MRVGGEEGLKGTNPAPSDEDMEDQGEKETGPGSPDIVSLSIYRQNNCGKRQDTCFLPVEKDATERAVGL